MIRNKILRRRGIAILLLSLLVALALYGKDIYGEISQSMRLYNSTYRQLLVNYVDPIKAEEFTEKALKNMLKELDPYTVFLTDEENEPLEVLSKGSYGGVGLQISLRNDTLTVITPMETGPAKRAGIFAGDKIVKVDTVSTTGMNLDQCAKLIRGEIGTPTSLTIVRPGMSDVSVYNLVRETIQVEDVSYAGFLENGVGYIKLTGFSRGASGEIQKALRSFGSNPDFRSVILDLRGNSGGLLDEALSVSELFTEVGDTILLTRGRTNTANKIFISKQAPAIPASIKMAVLIDQGSASASEIVAGVIQDLDRGVVVGQPSFGKGLVQTVYRLDDKHSLKITTAKYYIPSGRLIQKPDFIRNKDLVEDIVPADIVYHSRNGRDLKGGGGITPDLDLAEKNMPKYVRELWRQNMFYKYALNYKSGHPDLTTNLVVDATMLPDFQNFIVKNGFDYQTKNEESLKNVEKQMKEDENFKDMNTSFDEYFKVFNSIKAREFNQHEEYITYGILSELGTLLDGIPGRVKTTFRYDKAVQKALEVLEDGSDYQMTLGYAQ